MNADRWKHVEELFHQAADLAPTARAAWLDAHCAGDAELRHEVEALLASDEAGRGFLQNEVKGAIVDFHETQAPAAPRRAGPYKLVSELGRGGMGTVYLAERADDQYKGEVAIKLVRPGMDTAFFLARFRRERQTLARLQHRNIARLLDSGATEDGLPYIVMECIRGQAITAYCRARRLAVDEILRLFLPVCAAVSYAHHNFVIHRDLKPGNILVDEAGVPKLLDFGICKLLFPDPTGSETMTGAAMMTPDYASPEQVRGDAVGVATDVYSLGAVLYELLTGVRPHIIEKHTPREVERAICEEDVRVPSAAARDRALARRLAGDLDNILLKALQKDPARRYETVEKFAADIRCYLSYLPVAARPDSLAYRARKFVRRNRGAVAAASAVAFAMSGGIIASAHEAAVARRHFAEARKLANTLIFDVHDRVRDLPGSLQARQAIARTTLDYLDSLSASARSDPELRVELAAAYERIGSVQGNVLGSYTGDVAAAMQSYAKGLAVLQPLGDAPAAAPKRVLLLRRTGDIFEYTGRIPDALGRYEEAVRIGSGLRERDPAADELRRNLADVYDSLARVYRVSERRDQALAANSKCLALFRESLAAHPDDRSVRASLAAAISTQGTLLAGLNQLEAAKNNFLEATHQWDELVRQEPNSMQFARQRMLAYSHLGEVSGSPSYPNLGDYPGALRAFQVVLDAARRSYETNAADEGAQIDYGMALMRMASVPGPPVEERVQTYRQAITMLGRVAKQSPANAMNRLNLASLHEQFADLLEANRKTAEAREEYLQAAALAEENLEKILAARRIFVTTSRNLALDAARRGQTADAVRYAERAVGVGEKAAALPNAGTPVRAIAPRAYAGMGDVYEELHRPEEARRWRERALAAFQELQSRPDFNAMSRDEMRRVEAALKRKP